MIRLFAFTVWLTACAHQSLAAPQTTACALTDLDRAAIETLKANGFEIEDADQRQQFALDLIDCLADPDPVIRDGIAYEALATLMRSDALQTRTLRTMQARLTTILLPETPDPEGFGKPFAALILSEIARTDRMSAWMSDQDRSGLVDTGATYLEGITDYRGFDATEGWRHGVAHTADLMLQLSLNPALARDDAERMLTAIASQVAPASGHFYIYGEPDRLARPIVYLAQSGRITQSEWDDWLDQFTSPGDLNNWGQIFNSQAGLARRHNVKAFASTLHRVATSTEDENVQRLYDGSAAILAAIP